MVQQTGLIIVYNNPACCANSLSHSPVVTIIIKTRPFQLPSYLHLDFVSVVRKIRDDYK